MRRSALAWILRVVVRVWSWCLRSTRLGPNVKGPGIVAFWHGDQLALLGHRPKGPLVAPISLSEDGDLQADVMAGLGIVPVRGSPNRGAVGALRGLLRALSQGAICLVAVDGSRGPRHEAKSGALYLAQKARCPIWVAGVAVARGKELVDTWDRFLIPLPGTRTVAVFGEPWYPPHDVDPRTLTKELTARLHQAHDEAARMLTDR